VTNVLLGPSCDFNFYFYDCCFTSISNCVFDEEMFVKFWNKLRYGKVRWFNINLLLKGYIICELPECNKATAMNQTEVTNSDLEVNLSTALKVHLQLFYCFHVNKTFKNVPRIRVVICKGVWINNDWECGFEASLPHSWPCRSYDSSCFLRTPSHLLFLRWQFDRKADPLLWTSLYGQLLHCR